MKTTRKFLKLWLDTFYLKIYFREILFHFSILVGSSSLYLKKNKKKEKKLFSKIV